ncbi:MAG TPA: hypothetical protein VJ852_04160 [Gemmatimonadaceae bacterium]|nr:hypothetical protein [Gemmatimonadaceae bacterium]
MTKSHHHVPSKTAPASAEIAIRTGERFFLAARAPPMKPPATTGMMSELRT